MLAQERHDLQRARPTLALIFVLGRMAQGLAKVFLVDSPHPIASAIVALRDKNRSFSNHNDLSGRHAKLQFSRQSQAKVLHLRFPFEVIGCGLQNMGRRDGAGRDSPALFLGINRVALWSRSKV